MNAKQIYNILHLTYIIGLNNGSIRQLDDLYTKIIQKKL